ncbi:hypothetical protein FA95DRAFT_1277755 [Auriscalpium vulgare]|uniref:Uncharacterized protein n=1 Tax=Auriscalpium vulgare TaxID=40419 RepID=A0ACB8RTE5_9AGAM|nr:hypothetical protein FA95DRAFT_1277755 [Auriscalpium vulgare]
MSRGAVKGIFYSATTCRMMRDRWRLSAVPTFASFSSLSPETGYYSRHSLASRRCSSTARPGKHLASSTRARRSKNKERGEIEAGLFALLASTRGHMASPQCRCRCELMKHSRTGGHHIRHQDCVSARFRANPQWRLAHLHVRTVLGARVDRNTGG